MSILVGVITALVSIFILSNFISTFYSILVGLPIFGLAVFFYNIFEAFQMDKKKFSLHEIPIFLLKKKLSEWEKGFAEDLQGNFENTENFKPTPKQEAKLKELLEKYKHK